jgi:hypothetical protein
LKVKREVTSVYVGSVRIRQFDRPGVAERFAFLLKHEYGMPARTMRELVKE